MSATVVPMRRYDAMDLREIARACRAMAYQYEKDAERQGSSSSAASKREGQARFMGYAEELERLASERTSSTSSSGDSYIGSPSLATGETQSATRLSPTGNVPKSFLGKTNEGNVRHNSRTKDTQGT